MKNIIFTAIIIIMAHQAIGALMASDTVKGIQNHNKQLINAMESVK